MKRLIIIFLLCIGSCNAYALSGVIQIVFCAVNSISDSNLGSRVCTANLGLYCDGYKQCGSISGWSGLDSGSYIRVVWQCLINNQVVNDRDTGISNRVVLITGSYHRYPVSCTNL
jgi:hypothetical protein